MICGLKKKISIKFEIPPSGECGNRQRRIRPSLHVIGAGQAGPVAQRPKLHAAARMLESRTRQDWIWWGVGVLCLCAPMWDSPSPRCSVYNGIVIKLQHTFCKRCLCRARLSQLSQHERACLIGFHVLALVLSCQY